VSAEPVSDYRPYRYQVPTSLDDGWLTGPLHSVDGLLAAASGLRLRPRDLAKFGSLYLHDGRWRTRQIIPSDWVSESTRYHVALPSPSSALGIHGYGYQWWYTRYRTGFGTFEARTAAGNGQQRIYVLPALRLAVTILAGRYNDRRAARLADRLLLEHIIPAAMPENVGSTPEPPSCGRPTVESSPPEMTVARNPQLAVPIERGRLEAG